MIVKQGLPSTYSVGSPVAVGSTLYFTLDDGVHGEELWKSNGTAAGTVMVKDIQAGPYGSAPDYLTNIGGVLYFSADNGTNGYELWKSDGTVAGTTMVKDIYAGGASSQSQRFTNVNGTIYFSARNAENNYELWKTNGTSAGTTLVKEVGPGAVGSIARSFDDHVFLNANGVLVYIAEDNRGPELWRSDGTSAGTFLLKDIETGTGNAEVNNLTNLNGTLLFSGTDGTTGRQALWKLNGSTPQLIKNLWPGSDVTLHDFVVLGNRVLFTGDSPAGVQLWATDGTPAGTIPLGGMQPRNTTVVGNVVYFSALDGVNGRELWRSDGTAAGTKLVKDIAPGSTSSGPYSLTNVGGKLYFTAETATSGYELWKSDGTAAGTVLVKEIRSGASSAYPFNQTNVNGTLYFSANDGTNGFELWKSDGTAAGTVMVTNIAAGAAGSSPLQFQSIAGTVYFSANDGTTGFELWKSNGTAVGTVRVKDINPGSADSLPSNLQNVAGKLYFTANTAANGTEVWTSDGTAAGTVLLKDIRAGVGGSNPKLAVAGGKLYINANDGAGSQLWLTDGTTAGTVKVPNAAGQPVALNPQFVVDVGGTRYFAGISVAHGQELFALNVPQSFAGSAGVDSYVVTYSSSNVVVTRSINGGAFAKLGTFTLASPLTFTALTAVDLVRVVGTSAADTITVANTGTVGSTGINVNSSSLVISGAPILTISGAHSNDTYRFDADATLGLISLDEAAGGVDTLDFSLTTTSGVAVNLIAPGNQNINAKLSLRLNSATTFENIIGTPNGDLLLGNTLVNSINGANGHDVVVGNAGNDRLAGGSGRDILIGGAGLDALFGGDDEDILIAGKTDYDGVYSKLVELKTEWTSSNSYATRIARLRAGVGATLSKLKAKDTVDTDAGEIDTMTGGPDLPTAETDWFFRASNDVITDLLSETIDLL